MYLTSRPMNGNGKSISVIQNELRRPPQTPHTPIPGLRQLGFLPLHTHFRARVTIHHISNVPFVSGEFGLRWKFRRVRTPRTSKSGLLDRVMARAEKRTASDKGKAREDSADTNIGHPQMLMSPLPAAAPSSQAQPSDSELALSTPPPTILFTPARGMTPFLKLKNYSVVWSQTLDTVLEFDVDRETTVIQPSTLKLVVMQRAILDDDLHETPQHSRLGAVYVNLAEYIGQGIVERRYLLKESKTNVTLKITIEMTYVGGETNYRAPPLTKGEVLNGIPAFLQSDIVNRRPRVPDIYSSHHDDDELDIALFGLSERESEDEAVDDPDPLLSAMAAAFDVRRLPLVGHATKTTTEMLIDALFNPVRISDRRKQSPFTVYDPPSPPSAVQHRGVRHRRSARGKRHGSISSSVYTTMTTTTTSSVCSISSEVTVHPGIESLQDLETIYSKASSRTASTDYGLYYTRRAFSQDSWIIGES